MIGADASLAPQSLVETTAPRTIARTYVENAPQALVVSREIEALATGGTSAAALSNEMEVSYASNEMRFSAQVMAHEDSDIILELILLDVLGQPILDVTGDYILGS